MNCNKALTNLATGGVARRLLARWHLWRCRDCQRVRERFTQAIGQLAVIEPLADAERDAWMAAARTAVSVSDGRALSVTIRWASPVAASAFIALIASGLWLGTQKDHRGVVPDDATVSHVESPSSSDASWEGIELMRLGLMELSKELDEMTELATLLDEHDGVDELLSRFDGDSRQ